MVGVFGAGKLPAFIPLMHGVAHIRLSTSQTGAIDADGDFYAVFIAGAMSPIRFKSWLGAWRHFVCECEADQIEVAA